MIAKLRPFKYTLSYLLFLVPWFSIHQQGIASYSTLVLFLVLPLIDYLIKPDYSNLSEEDEEKASENIWYSIIIYALIPFFFYIYWQFLSVTTRYNTFSIELVGVVLSAGILIAIGPILFGHELGHHLSKFDQFLAKVLLVFPLYMHFYISHNRGHHRIAATYEDPGTARKSEGLYKYCVRAISKAYLSAWKMENQRVKSQYGKVFTWYNEMIIFSIVEIYSLVAIYLYFGPFQFGLYGK